MLKFYLGFAVGVVAGFLLGLYIPMPGFVIVCLVVTLLLIGMLILFHFGVRDFQDY